MKLIDESTVRLRLHQEYILYDLKSGDLAVGQFETGMFLARQHADNKRSDMYCRKMFQKLIQGIWHGAFWVDTSTLLLPLGTPTKAQKF